MKHFLWCCFLAVSLAHGVEPLPPSLVAALQRAKLPPSALSLVIAPVDGRSVSFENNADVPVNPASTMKLVTSYVALDTLGPSWQWITELRSLAVPVNGVLEGDVYLKGGGDPKLTIERLWLLLRDLRLQGVREIRGDLVLDRSLFTPGSDASVFDDDGNSSDRPFLVGPDALLTNFKTLRLRLQATSGGVAAQLEPPLPEVRIDNRLLVGPVQDCAQWRSKIKFMLDDQKREATLMLSGTMPAGCAGERYLAALDHVTYTASLTRLLWRDLGGVWTGAVRQELTPPESLLLAQTRSPELPLVLRDINKFSNNQMARQLYLTLGAVLGRADAGAETAERSAGVIGRWLVARGWNWPELVLENGAGLSRTERLSARHLADLLQDAGRGPLAAEFISALPIVAVDGTMKKRLTGEAVAGQAHIKTGTLKDVRAIAGYVRTNNGDARVVVAILNHPRAAEGAVVLDEALRQAYSMPIGNSARP